MPRQIVIIHGGSFLSKGEDMLTNLREEEVTIDDFKPRRRGWRENLEDTLGKGFEVLQPDMPNWQNAQYEEWKIWFEKMIPFLHDGIILIGHSLGGGFLAKYLSENTFPKKIGALLLVSSPYSDPKDKDDFASFTLQDDLGLIARQIEAVGGVIIIYHSKDDPIVSFDSLAQFAAKIPTAQKRIFEDRRHFLGAQFPEIVEDIKKLK
jgi:predicted alpha/beta hydrolase family esterase